MRKDILERKDDIIKWVGENRPKAYMCTQLKCKPETLERYLRSFGIVYAGNMGGKGYKHNGYKTVAEYIKSPNVKNHVLRLKLLKEHLKEEKCEICGASMWCGKKLALELHHKDGNHFNNELSNLQILCPNCHSVQEGYCGQNIGTYAAVSEQE